MPGALADLTILDFSRVLAGPFATMLLGDLGARVIKVERPGSGDDTRHWGPPYDEAGEATYFLSVNRNKESALIDLGSDAGIAQARALAAEADVVVENFRPGLMESFGLGYEQLVATRPGLVYCAITGYGSSGPGAALPGYDFVAQAQGGLMSITGEPGGEPQKVGVALVDVLAGLFSTVGILAALRHRDATGEGQRVEVDLLSSVLAALVNQGSAFTAGGVVASRLGNVHPSIAPYETISCADGTQLVLAVGNDRQFTTLCEVAGVTQLASEERFATNPARVANRAALHGELAAALAARTAAEWAELLAAARVPAGVVNDIGEAFAFAASLGLEPIVKTAREDGTIVNTTRNPIRLSATPASYRSAPPRLP